MKKILTGLMIVAVAIGLASTAQATTPNECVPYERYSYTPHGDPVDSTPITDPTRWQVNHKGYDGSPTGVLIHQGQGNGSYFYWVANDCPDPSPTPSPSVSPDPQVTVSPTPDPGPEPRAQIIRSSSYVPECTVPADGTVTMTRTDTSLITPYVLVDGVWVLGDETFTATRVTVTVYPYEGCAVQTCPPGTVAGSPDENGVFTCQNDNPIPEPITTNSVTTTPGECVDGVTETTVTTTYTETPYVLVGDEWVPGETVTEISAVLETVECSLDEHEAPAARVVRHSASYTG